MSDLLTEQLLALGIPKKQDNEYRPALFRADHADDRDRLGALLDTEKSVFVHDDLLGQLRSLIESRNPSRTLSDSEVNGLISAHLDGRVADRYGIWVYYPWSRRLVHLLEEDEFVELRTSRNQYKITREEQALLAEKVIGVIGLSVGQSVALTMAIERSFGEIRLADFDSLDLTNLNRLRCGLHCLGAPKVVIAAREIAEIDPFLRVRCFSDGITEDNLDDFLVGSGKISLLIEECDSLDIKFLCRQRAKALSIPVVMDTSDSGMIDVERFDLEPDRPLFHGLVKTPDLSVIKKLSSDEKVPFVLDILEQDQLSTRLRASMLEVANSIPTWPQLATAVALGGAVTGDVCRRILLDYFRSSGRYRIDLEHMVGDVKTASDKTDPAVKAHMHETPRDFSFDPELLMPALDAPGESIALSNKIVSQLVEKASMAPSGGNTQPWRWIWSGSRLWLFRDAPQSFLDADYRATYLALGAAVENLVLATHEVGMRIACNRRPSDCDDRFVAAFTFHQHTKNSAALEPQRHDRLAPYLATRLTNRVIGDRLPVDAGKLRLLEEIANDFGKSSLELLDSDSDLAEIGDIIAAGDRLRMLHSLGHTDFVNEMRWTPDSVASTRDGIDPATVDLTDAECAGLELMRDWNVVDHIRKLGTGKGFETLSRKSVKGASAVGLLRTQVSEPIDFLDAGRLVQKVWLEATRLGLAFQPMSVILFCFARLHSNPPIEGKLSPEMERELPDLYERFRKLFPRTSSKSDVFLFRLAIADQPKVRSLRRHVSEVLTFA